MRLPLLSALLAALAGGLMLLPAGAHAALYFDYQSALDGQWWRLLSGHWIHADVAHLSWNLAGLLVLGAVIEQRSRRLLLWSVLVGTIAVDLLLLAPLGGPERYCGLSGLLNTLMGVALYLCWRDSRSPVIAVTAALYLLKIAVEIHSGQSVITSISWPPYPIAHLVGLAGAPVALACAGARRPCCGDKHHGYLVPGK